MRPAFLLGILALALFAFAGPALGQVDQPRFFVSAVADADQPRILVRWAQIEGGAEIYTAFDILRRTKDESGLTTLNGLPVVPKQSVAEIETIFLDPANADALSWIQAAFGSDYALEVLLTNQPPLTDDLLFRRLKLSEQNYAAAIAMGLGYMDTNVVAGETYIYEIWGLDEQGLRVERLGRASATTGQPPILDTVPSQECVKMGGAQGHAAAFVRWDENPPQRGSYLAGYDVLRVAADELGNCPPSMRLGDPGVVQANQFAGTRQAPGDVFLGESLFENSCIACHASRNDLAGLTLADFERHSPDFGKGPEHANLALTSDEKLTIFRYIEEFHFRDEGDDTPEDPLTIGQRYCYLPAPRDLLGQHTQVSINPVACEVADRLSPAPPMNMASERVDLGGYETCRISWRRNTGADDDTTNYLVYRVPLDQLPRATRDVGIVNEPEAEVATLPQPTSGARVTWEDPGLSVANAGEPYHYAVVAQDAAGNRSPFSSWVPCVPRDLVAPDPPTLTGICFDNGERQCCDDRRADPEWTEAGGLPVLFMNPHEDCKPQLTCNRDADAFGCRLLRGFDGLDYRASQDFSNDLQVDWEPAVDTRLYVEAQAFDKSMNFSPASGGGLSFILQGKWRLPPPRITEVVLTGDQLDPTVKIRFRSLKPEQLIGFVLYKGKPESGQQPTGTLDQIFVTRLPAQNLFSDPLPATSSPPVWGPKATAQTLDQVDGLVQPIVPTTPGEYLYFETSSGQYEMQVDIGETENVVLFLAAVGWSGIEGLSRPYVWDGWIRGDGILDWPSFQFQVGSDPLDQQKAQLNGIYNSANNTIELDWEPWPDACGVGDDSTYVIFRRRTASVRWKQLTAPFRCDDATPNLVTYVDEDIDEGLSYDYLAIRQDSGGEFLFQHGPKRVSAE